MQPISPIILPGISNTAPTAYTASRGTHSKLPSANRSCRVPPLVSGHHLAPKKLPWATHPKMLPSRPPSFAPISQRSQRRTWRRMSLIQDGTSEEFALTRVLRRHRCSSRLPSSNEAFSALRRSWNSSNVMSPTSRCRVSWNGSG